VHILSIVRRDHVDADFGRAFEPVRYAILGRDHRHPVMDVHHESIGLRCQYREAVDSLAVDCRPIPKAGDEEYTTVSETCGVGLLGRALPMLGVRLHFR